MRFRVAGQFRTGEWANIANLGDHRLSFCKALARDAWASSKYAFVCIYNSKGQRRWWLGNSVGPGTL